ncbi:DUF4136 domain-containing protein [Hydrogenimonas urashimensis]|uniref:DUF4136 domain-containing protein n=1 Tax=Hydrogenimonas urashimensis TaxID=2740515 RepID=UPI00191585D3|nr:DUF4136 domain-containing protein [Hydrogenimonas urashimensis]
MIRTIAALVVTLVLFAGCSSHTLESKKDETYDFSKLQSVAVIHPTIDDPRTTSAQKIFDRLIAETMKKKGYEVTDKAHADFYITYHLGATNQRQLSNDYRIIGIAPTYYSPYYGNYGYSYVVGKSTQSYEVSEGKIIVEAIDPHHDNLVFWNAKMTDKLKRFKTPEEREAFIKQVVTKVFKSFPDKKASN